MDLNPTRAELTAALRRPLVLVVDSDFLTCGLGSDQFSDRLLFRLDRCFSWRLLRRSEEGSPASGQLLLVQAQGRGLWRRLQRRGSR